MSDIVEGSSECWRLSFVVEEIQFGFDPREQVRGEVRILVGEFNLKTNLSRRGIVSVAMAVPGQLT